MAYVAVRGGRKAIDESLERLKRARLRGGTSIPVRSIKNGLRQLIDQVMAEGSLYDAELASVAIKQAEGSPEEAVFLLRAFRSTLPRKRYTRTVDPGDMRVERRISACFKDVPGGQILGASPDYAHRLIDFDLCEETDETAREWTASWEARVSGGDDAGESRDQDGTTRLPKVLDYLRREGLLPDRAPRDDEPADITMKGLSFPTTRAERLQILARGQTGAVTALGYAALRGYGLAHPTVGELRVGLIPLVVDSPADGGTGTEEGDGYYIGEVRVTEVESLIPVPVERGRGKTEIEFDIGYGVTFGQNETKAIAMSILDYCLETRDARFPTHDEEFVLYHVDSVESTGFISHLKLPHYVTFQAKLDGVRKARGGKET